MAELSNINELFSGVKDFLNLQGGDPQTRLDFVEFVGKQLEELMCSGITAENIDTQLEEVLLGSLHSDDIKNIEKAIVVAKAIHEELERISKGITETKTANPIKGISKDKFFELLSVMFDASRFPEFAKGFNRDSWSVIDSWNMMRSIELQECDKQDCHSALANKGIGVATACIISPRGWFAEGTPIETRLETVFSIFRDLTEHYADGLKTVNEQYVESLRSVFAVQSIGLIKDIAFKKDQNMSSSIDKLNDFRRAALDSGICPVIDTIDLTDPLNNNRRYKGLESAINVILEDTKLDNRFRNASEAIDAFKAYRNLMGNFTNLDPIPKENWLSVIEAEIGKVNSSNTLTAGDAEAKKSPWIEAQQMIEQWD